MTLQILGFFFFFSVSSFDWHCVIPFTVVDHDSDTLYERLVVRLWHLEVLSIVRLMWVHTFWES